MNNTILFWTLLIACVSLITVCGRIRARSIQEKRNIEFSKRTSLTFEELIKNWDGVEKCTNLTKLSEIWKKFESLLDLPTGTLRPFDTFEKELKAPSDEIFGANQKLFDYVDDCLYRYKQGKIALPQTLPDYNVGVLAITLTNLETRSC